MTRTQALESLANRREALTTRYLAVQAIDARRDTMDVDVNLQLTLRALAREIHATSAAIRELTVPKRSGWVQRLLSLVARLRHGFCAPA